MGKERTSIVWRFFTKENNDDKFVICNLCKKKVCHSGGTTNMRTHFKTVHAREFEAASGGEVQPTTSALANKNQDHYHLVKFIAKDLQPFSVVEDEGFKGLIKYLMPSFNMPSRQFVSKTLIPTIYDEVRHKLRALIDATNYIGCTTDLWTSRTQTPYLTLTVHFVTEARLVSAVLGSKSLPGSHTGLRIAGCIDDILKEWGCKDKVAAFTTDNGSNVVSAINILGFRHIPCVAHTINLLVHDAINGVIAVLTVLIACKTIVNFFKSSSVANEVLVEMMARLGNDKSLRLIKSVATRWNSDLDMVNRILDLADSLTMAQLRLPNAPPPLSPTEFQLLGDISLLLQPFKSATVDLSGDYPTASLVVPMVLSLRDTLACTSANVKTDDGKNLAEALRQGVSARLFQYENLSTTRASTFLNPRFKRCGFRVQENFDEARRQIESELRFQLGEANQQQPPAQQMAQGSGLLSSLQARVEASRSAATPASASYATVHQYVLRPPRWDEDVVNYWMGSRPVDGEALARVAEKYIVVPATSVPSERVFSTAGQVISDRRSSLKPEKAAQLIFLKQNSWLYQDNKAKVDTPRVYFPTDKLFQNWGPHHNFCN